MSTVPELEHLTEREMRIVELVAAGHNSRSALASAINLSIHAVDKILNQIGAKLPGHGTPLLKVAFYAGKHTAMAGASESLNAG